MRKFSEWVYEEAAPGTQWLQGPQTGAEARRSLLEMVMEGGILGKYLDDLLAVSLMLFAEDTSKMKALMKQHVGDNIVMDKIIDNLTAKVQTIRPIAQEYLSERTAAQKQQDQTAAQKQQDQTAEPQDVFTQAQQAQGQQPTTQRPPTPNWPPGAPQVQR